MDLLHLRNFLTIIEQRSISNAASLIRIAQPALSRQVQALEKQVGCPLLVRHRWGVSPTPAGELMAEQAREILARVQSLQDSIGAMSRTPSGTLSIGVTASIAALILPPFALAARQAMPQVRLRLTEAYSGTLQQRLLARELDLAVLHVREASSSLELEPLLTEPVVVVGAAGVFKPGETVTLRQVLRHEAIVTAASGRLRLLYEEVMASARLAPTHFMEVDSFPALLELLAAGAGVSLLPFSTIQSGVEANRLSWAELAPKPQTRRLVLARLQERIKTPAWREAARLIRDIVEARQEQHRWTIASRPPEEP
jgi:LysR family nitrogen assimilation transcriptional regulator